MIQMKNRMRFQIDIGRWAVGAMLVFFMALMVMTNEAKAATAYDVWIGGQQFTSEKTTIRGTTGTATYDDTHNTLTLNNYTYRGPGMARNELAGSDYPVGIYLYTPNGSTYTIKLIGDNSIILENDETVENVAGIYANTNDYNFEIKIEATTQETGNLTIDTTGTTATGSNRGICSLGSKRTISMSRCIVDVFAGPGSDNSDGIRSGTISLNTVELNVSGQKYGIYAEKNVSTCIYFSSYSRVFAKGNFNALKAAGGSSSGISLNGTNFVTAIADNTGVGGDWGALSCNSISARNLVGSTWTKTDMSDTGNELEEITKDNTVNGDIKVVRIYPPHTHFLILSESESGSTINVNCASNNCSLLNPETTITITAPLHTTFGDGKDPEAIIKDPDRVLRYIQNVSQISYFAATKTGDTYEKTGSELQGAPTAAGDYWAEITLTHQNEDDNTVYTQTAGIGYSIGKTPMDPPADEAAAKAQLVIDYTGETLSVKDGYEVSSTDGEATAIENFSEILDEDDPVVYVRTLASDEDHVPSVWVAVHLNARPAAPELTTSNADNSSTANGQIIGMTVGMEYSTDKGATWTDVTAGDNPLSVVPGTYLVRTKATETTPSGKIATVKVGSNYTPLDTVGETTSVTVVLPEGHEAPAIGDVLTAECEATHLTYQWYCDGTPIENATNSTYTVGQDDLGKTITVVVTQTRKEDGSSYDAGSEPTLTSAATAAVVKKFPPAAPESIEVTGFTADYSTETFTVGDAYEICSNDGGETTDSLTAALDGSGKVYVRLKETEDTQAGNCLEITLTARPEAPTGFIPNNASNLNSSDGAIFGTYDYMEYKLKDSADEWQSAIGEPEYAIYNLAAGTYLVRYKADGNNPASKAAEVKVGSDYIPLDVTNGTTPVTVTLPEGHNAPAIGDVLTCECDATNLVYQWYRGDDPIIDNASSKDYTVTADDYGYAIKVKVRQTVNENGEWMAPSNWPELISASTATVVKKDPPAAPTSTEGIIFVNYGMEKVMIWDSAYEVLSSNDANGTPIEYVSDALDGDGKIYVRLKETDDTQAGLCLEVQLPSRPDAPTGLTTENATGLNEYDGKIIGTASGMEFMEKDNPYSYWQLIYEESLTVSPGTYLVRYSSYQREENYTWIDVPASRAVEVTVGVDYTALTEDNKPVVIDQNGNYPPQVGDTIKAGTTATDLLYQWYRDGQPISGATGELYTLTMDDIGKAITVTVTQTKDANGQTYAENARPTQTSQATAAVVKQSPAAIDVDTARSNITISYAGETVTPQDGYEISTNGTSKAESPVSLTAVLDGEGTPQIYVRTVETDYTAAGEWVVVTLTARPTAPSGLTVTSYAESDTTKGTVTGANDTMEYKLNDSSVTTWTVVTSSDALSLDPGTYLFRKAATDGAPHGKTTSVEVGVKSDIELSDAPADGSTVYLKYTESELTLLNINLPNTYEGCTVYYSSDGENWGTAPLTETNEGTYTVHYKIDGGSNYKSIDPRQVTVVISSRIALNESSTPLTIKNGENALGNDVPVVGDTLTAECSATDLLYQWYRDGQEISDATSSSYTLTKDDYGKAITVKVTQTRDQAGNEITENRPSLTSTATAAVSAPVSMGDKGYLSIEAALQDAAEEDTIVLNKFVNSDVSIANGKNVILDLNGCTLMGNVTNSGTLTIKDSSGNSGRLPGTIQTNGGNTVIESGRFDNVPDDPQDEGSVTIKGGYFKGNVNEAMLAGEDYKIEEYSSSGTFTPAWADVNYSFRVVEISSYTVTFDANGGNGTMSDQTISRTVVTQLYANKFSKEGFVFEKWNTKADGNGTSYEDKAEITLSANTTLYAQWKESKDHNHLPLKEVNAVEPGCETEGNKHYYECETCRKIFEDPFGQVELTKDSVIIKAKGHKWDNGEITREATYDETGIRTYTCENDSSHTREEEIPRKTRSEEKSEQDNSKKHDSSDSGSSSNSGSSGSSGSSSNKSSSSTNAEIQAKVDQINNGTSFVIPENHQAESGLPVSDAGGNWDNNADNWTYTKSDGSFAVGEWMNLDYNGLRYWYYFDNNGIMQTNWFDYNNERYYLVPQMDGWRGRMATGWKNIENKWYYFETVPGSSQGRLYRSTFTPDGHKVGADGAWDGVGTTPIGQE